jgi:F-type H+-transporting ATPase subunit h
VRIFENLPPKQKKTDNSCYESQAKDAHVGVVKNYSSPPIPKAPVLPGDLASELAAYDATEPAIAEVAAPTSASEESGAGGAEAYLAFLEEDLPKPVRHHH